MKALNSFFNENKKIALAYSGGADSTYLLYVAKSCGADVRPYFIKTVFQPEFEFKDAKKATQELGIELAVVEMDVLSNSDIKKNEVNRCYYCKKALFTKLIEIATAEGYALVIDGSNASDDPESRPGMRALAELGVKSPLLECGLTKADVRSLSKEAGIFTWDKPAYACLSTRIPTGVEITKEVLCYIEASENLLFSLGFKDFRVRVINDFARIQISEGQMGVLIEKRETILKGIKGFSGVFLDLTPRQ